jgi:hypothetical protein
MRFAVLTLVVFSLIGARASAQTFDTCRSVGQAMIDLQKGVGDASVAALKEGSLSQTLAGTNPRKNHAYHDIETEAANVDNGIAEGYRGIGALLAARFSDQHVADATGNVVTEARAELKLLGAYGGAALMYERMENHSNKRMSGWLIAGTAIVSPVAAAGLMAGANGSRTTTSETTSTVSGNQVYAHTTTTGPGPDEIARAFANAEANAQTTNNLEVVLITFEPQIEDSVYTINPLVQRWVNVCRAAKQLAPDRLVRWN